MWMVFPGYRSVEEGSSPVLIGWLSSLSVVGFFCWQEDWQWGSTGPIKHDCRLKCILTLADLISWIRGRAKRKEVIMISVSYYGIDLLTWTNTHRTKTEEYFRWWQWHTYTRERWVTWIAAICTGVSFGNFFLPHIWLWLEINRTTLTRRINTALHMHKQCGVHLRNPLQSL